MLKMFEGYVTEIDYIPWYHRNLAPLLLRAAARNHPISLPTGRPLRYLELGYGNGGIALNIHAAASPGEYWGIDVNPSHVASANILADASGSGLRVLGGSFADLLNRHDLPRFDVIGMHGVWSWISAANRKAIVELLGRKLVDGGMFYVNYNAMPGSAAIVPLQRLLRLHTQTSGGGGTILEKLGTAIGFAGALRRAGSRYFSEGGPAAERIESFEAADPAYLCHEYLNENWEVLSFAEMAQTLSEAGLYFGASANLLDQFDDLNFSTEGMALLDSIEDPCVRETARDFLRNREYRTDIFIKGDATAPLPEGEGADLDLEFVLALPAVSWPKAVEAPIGQIDLSGTPFVGILNLLREEKCGALSLRSIVAQIPPEAAGKVEIVRALMILVHAGIVYLAQPRGLIDRAVGPCSRLNEQLLRWSMAGQKVDALASPVTGGGVRVSRNQQLFLLALRQGAHTADEWARFAWDVRAKEKSDRGLARPAGDPIAVAILKEALVFDRFLPILTALKLV